MNEVPSKETMETDLENTKKEVDAVSKILEGYKTLQSLPENPPNSYRVEIRKFDSYLRECTLFYQRIQRIFEKNYGTKPQEVSNDRPI